MQTLDDWKAKGIDWTQNDSTISRAQGVSRERIRQVRHALAIDHPPHKHLSAKAIALANWFKANMHLSGTLSAEEVAGLAGVTQGTVYKAAERNGFALKRLPAGGEPDPRWALMNFDLPSRDLVTIWQWVDPPSQKKGFRIGQYRWRKGLQGPKWDGRSNAADMATNPEYRHAYTAEVVKAETYFQGCNV